MLLSTTYDLMCFNPEDAMLKACNNESRKLQLMSRE